MYKIQTAKKPDKDRKVTFYAKEPTRCPVCDASFHREELFSGRVSADEMTDELHRTYKPLSAFGEVHPLVYELETCPSCFYSAFKQDFMPAGTKFSSELRDRIETRTEEAASSKDRGHAEALSLAARFAAKEAFGKALGTGLAGMRLRDIQVINNHNGRPDMILHGTALERFRALGAARVLVSLTHESDNAVAVVVIEG